MYTSYATPWYNLLAEPCERANSDNRKSCICVYTMHNQFGAYCYTKFSNQNMALAHIVHHAWLTCPGEANKIQAYRLLIEFQAPNQMTWSKVSYR